MASSPITLWQIDGETMETVSQQHNWKEENHKWESSLVRPLGSIFGLGRSPGEGNGNPFQYSRLENSMDGGAW